MPLKRYLDDPGIGPETARAMTVAFKTITARVNELGLRISPAAIAQKLSALAHDGETNAARLAEAVLDGLVPRE